MTREAEVKPEKDFLIPHTSVHLCHYIRASQHEVRTNHLRIDQVSIRVHMDNGFSIWYHRVKHKMTGYDQASSSLQFLSAKGKWQTSRRSTMTLRRFRSPVFRSLDSYGIYWYWRNVCGWVVGKQFCKLLTIVQVLIPVAHQSRSIARSNQQN